MVVIFFVFILQHESGTAVADNSTCVELSIVVNAKSTTNFTESRQRPLSVPVHTPAASQAYRRLVSNNTPFV